MGNQSPGGFLECNLLPTPPAPRAGSLCLSPSQIRVEATAQATTSLAAHGSPPTICQRIREAKWLFLSPTSQISVFFPQEGFLLLGS